MPIQHATTLPIIMLSLICVSNVKALYIIKEPCSAVTKCVCPSNYQVVCLYSAPDSNGVEGCHITSDRKRRQCSLPKITECR